MGLPAHQLYASPLRYPGGKRKLANFIKLVMLRNQLVGCEYVEPYAGGASVALSLLFEDYASHIHINDVNRSVSAFWTAALDHTDELCSRIETAKVTVPEWRRQRQMQSAEDPDLVELAFSTFYLNRTSRSGVIGGGVIGGWDQTGEWKIDARFNRSDLIRRIEKIGRFRSRITVTGCDAAAYLRTNLDQIDSPFLYLDPPYYVKGSNLYEDYYGPEDHEQIAAAVQALDHPWIVSYDAAAEIRRLYRGCRRLQYDLRYTAATRYQGSEQMFFSDGMKLPKTDGPANVSYGDLDKARLAV